jgi:hypothetical protein
LQDAIDIHGFHKQEKKEKKYPRKNNRQIMSSFSFLDNLPFTAWKDEGRNRHKDRKMYLRNFRGLRDCSKEDLFH